MICSVTNCLVVSQGFGQRLYSSILSQLGSHPLLIDMCGLGNAFKASACAQVSLIFQFLLDSQGLLDLLYTCVVSQTAKDVSSLSQLFYAYFNSRITLLNFWLLHHLLWTWTLSSSRQGYLKHFPLCPTKVKVKSLSQVTTLRPHDPLPGSSMHGIFQGRVLERIAISFSSWPRDQTRASRTADKCFTFWATREALTKFS